MPVASETKKVLIVVKTYPMPAKKGVEVSCTAGITDDRKWIRLFPIPYRFLSDDRRFQKYQWISVNVVRPSGDIRPESYRLTGSDAIQVLDGPLPTTGAWRARREVILPLRASSLCYLVRERNERQVPTLGIFRPKEIKKLVIERTSDTWTRDELAILRQSDFFDERPSVELEKVPYTFLYKFSCDDDSCNGHELSCWDWEMGEAWRRWRDKYRSGWEVKFRQRFETEMIEKKDTHFFVGTVHRHPNRWIIVGLFYPPKTQQSDLFGLG